MFDIGFGELLIIAIVALVVLGPEKLPKAARFAGLWVRRARAQWASVKSELERDLAAEELRKSMNDTRDAMRGIDDSVRKTEADLRREFADVQDSVSGRPARGASAATAADQTADSGHDDANSGTDDARMVDEPVPMRPAPEDWSAYHDGEVASHLGDHADGSAPASPTLADTSAVDGSDPPVDPAQPHPRKEDNNGVG